MGILADLLEPAGRDAVAPDHAIPYVSTVDGGLVDLVRSAGAEVVSVRRTWCRSSRRCWTRWATGAISRPGSGCTG
jgi:hypothetical protein